jgi:hypothetical protein
MRRRTDSSRSTLVVSRNWTGVLEIRLIGGWIALGYGMDASLADRSCPFPSDPIQNPVNPSELRPSVLCRERSLHDRSADSVHIYPRERVNPRRTATRMSPVDIFISLSIVQRRRFQEHSSSEWIRSVRIVKGRWLGSGEDVRIGRDLIGVSMGYVAVVKEHLIHGTHRKKPSTFNVFTVHLLSLLSI